MNQSSEDPFEIYSINQIVGGCLDWVKEVLITLISDYISSGNPIIEDKLDVKKHQDWDILGLISFIINNYTNLTNIVQMEDPPLGRTLLFLIKNQRNRWAHQQPFNLQDTHRVCDSIEMFFKNLNDTRFSSYIEKLVMIRENCCIRMAQEIYEKHNQSSQNMNPNLTNNLEIEANHSNFQTGNSTTHNQIQHNVGNFSQHNFLNFHGNS